MRKVLFLIVFILLLTGCNQALTVTEVNMDKVSGRLKEAIEEFANENGNYLFSNGKEQYIFLNRINVNASEGENITALSHFKAEVKENTLYISFDEEIFEVDYDENQGFIVDDKHKDLTHQMLYKIKGGEEEYDTIDLIGNSESTHFDSSISY